MRLKRLLWSLEARLSHKVAKADRKAFEQGDLKDLLAGINSLKQSTFDRYRTRFAAAGEGLHRTDDSGALRDEIASRLADVHGNYIKRSLNAASDDRRIPSLLVRRISSAANEPTPTR